MQVILSLGTNTDYNNIAIAEQRLNNLFSAVRVSRTIISPAVNSQPDTADFANAIYVGDTVLSYNDLCASIKLIEWEMGRRRDGTNKVEIDIDLLLYDTQLFKPQDWHRPYNETLIREMGY